MNELKSNDNQEDTSSSQENITVGRILYRPTIYLCPFLLNIFLPIIATVLLGVGLYYTLINISMLVNYALTIVLIFCPCILLLYTMFRLKSIAIWCIRVYQCIAPTAMRLSCCMTPSCSEYMIMAITKYGLFKGMKKGIARLKRCCPDNENEVDNP